MQREALINHFEDHLMENGIAGKTIESYTGDVRGFYQLRIMKIE